MNPTPRKDDPDFWTDVLSPRTPAWREPGEDDLITLADDVHDAADRLARAISTRAADYHEAGSDFPLEASAAPDYQLALLHALWQITRSAESRAATAAKVAGHCGAGYPDLGTAWGGITRQSARKKWPDAVRRPGTPDPITLELAGGRAVLTELPDDIGHIWEATGEDGEQGEADEPLNSQAEAAAHAGAWLQQHEYGPDEAHADGLTLRLGTDGDPVDYDGNPV
ncbi:hypothetical protein ACIO3O_40070 [Streptomyces sp. NPDC087440]|uniref:hypothetical protein n=1 Tax=Streptomyces sp. NPDC087440 TaxID=3365790 RepID=UPI0037FC433F